MKRTALIIMLLTLFSKALGFFREIALSYFFGASEISDAYLISLTIPSVIFGFVGIGLATSYIPIASKIENLKGPNARDSYTSNLSNIIIVIIIILLIVCLLFVDSLVQIFALGFNVSTLNLTIAFTRISLVGMLFTSVLAIFTGYMQINGNFIVPALIGLPLNLIVIVSIYLSSKFDVRLLVMGTVIGTASQLLFLLPFLLQNGYRHSWSFKMRDENIVNTLKIAIPIIIGTSVNQINVLVDKSIASTIAIGGISALNYANRLNQFVQSIFVTSIITVMYPIISKLVSSQKISDMKKVVLEVMNLILIFVIPITLGTIVFSKEIIKILFGRGAFDLNAIHMTSSALLFYSIGMVGYGFREILSKVFYSLGDSVTPVKNASIGMVINIILNFVLSKYMGIAGLALATSIAALITSLMMIFNLRKKTDFFELKYLGFTFVKILLSSVIMSIFVKIIYIVFISFLNVYFALIIAVLFGVIIYCLLIIYMKIENVDNYVAIIKMKLIRKS